LEINGLYVRQLWRTYKRVGGLPRENSTPLRTGAVPHEADAEHVVQEVFHAAGGQVPKLHLPATSEEILHCLAGYSEWTAERAAEKITV
jgi:hypothetical protein